MIATTYRTMRKLDADLIRQGCAPMNAEQIETLETVGPDCFEMLDDWEARLRVDVSDVRGECAAYVNAREEGQQIGRLLASLVEENVIDTAHNGEGLRGAIVYVLAEMEGAAYDEAAVTGRAADHVKAHLYNRLAEILGNAWEQARDL